VFQAWSFAVQRTSAQLGSFTFAIQPRLRAELKPKVLGGNKNSASILARFSHHALIRSVLHSVASPVMEFHGGVEWIGVRC
jgi:hypothetical protein